MYNDDEMIERLGVYAQAMTHAITEPAVERFLQSGVEPTDVERITSVLAVALDQISELLIRVRDLEASRLDVSFGGNYL